MTKPIRQDLGELGRAAQGKPFLRLNLGLGDAIALSGAAVVLAKRHGGLIFPCLAKYEVSVKSIFVNHPEIEVVELESAREMWQRDDVIIGMEETMPEHPDVDHYQWLYRKLEVPYQCRWSWNPIPRFSCDDRSMSDGFPVPTLPPEDEDGKYLIRPYSFVHDDPDRKFWIRHDKLPQIGMAWYPPHVEGSHESSILRHVDVLECAAEVHVIDSCFFHLAEQLNPTGKLFLHRYARPYYPGWNDYKTRHEWTILT